MDLWICSTCGVESAERTDACAICADERQWVPATGQRWTTLEQLSRAGHRAELTELEPDLLGLGSFPPVGIGQQSKLLRTDAGNLLWDPIGYVDQDIADRVLQFGPVSYIAASHPHMFGAQVEWSRALGGVEVLVAEADAGWVRRPDQAVTTWSGDLHPLPGVTLTQPGGHFPGSAVAHWAEGAGGRGVLLSSDTIFANPDRKSVSFMRSFPNRLPLSAAVVDRIVRHVGRFEFDRLYGNFDDFLGSGAKHTVRDSADRHIRWISGEFDHLT